VRSRHVTTEGLKSEINLSDREYQVLSCGQLYISDTNKNRVCCSGKQL